MVLYEKINLSAGQVDFFSGCPPQNLVVSDNRTTFTSRPGRTLLSVDKIKHSLVNAAWAQEVAGDE